MKSLKLVACIASASLLIACGGDSSSSKDSPIQKVINTNADIAYATYTDSVVTAEALKTAIATFKAEPTADNLAAAKTAWLVAREPYGQTEVYRFRETPIDDNFSTSTSNEDGPEGAINAWPLGEGLIDYVNTGVNGDDFDDAQIGSDHIVNTVLELPEVSKIADPVGVTTAQDDNIIGNTAVEITPALLEASEGGDGSDVISGYHAIEFILWGQDLNNDGDTTDGTDRATAVKTNGVANLATGGQRPLSDFTTDVANPDSPAARRHKFLEVVVDKLIADLKQVQAGWAKGDSSNYRASFTTIANEADGQNKLAQILTGMGSLSNGELAGERMQIAFSSNSQEDEHSCFSDNTHRDIWLNAEGVSNSFTGTYAGYDDNLDGTDNVTTNAVNGYGINDYLANQGLTDLSAAVTTALAATEAGYKAIDASARNGVPFDVLIQPALATEEGIVGQTILALSNQAVVLQNVANGLDLDAVLDPEGNTACNTQNPTAACEE